VSVWWSVWCSVGVFSLLTGGARVGAHAYRVEWGDQEMPCQYHTRLKISNHTHTHPHREKPRPLTTTHIHCSQLPFCPSTLPRNAAPTKSPSASRKLRGPCPSVSAGGKNWPGLLPYRAPEAAKSPATAAATIRGLWRFGVRLVEMCVCVCVCVCVCEKGVKPSNGDQR
jgi:hypothetical protein